MALHNLGQDVFPVVFVGAGLPSLPAVLADATSYAERLYDYRQIGLLDTASTGDALTSPAHAHGVEWATGDDTPSSMAELVTRLQKKRTTDLSVNRRDLIRGGHIYTPERGLVALTVPGMAGVGAKQSE